MRTRDEISKELDKCDDEIEEMQAYKTALGYLFNKTIRQQGKEIINPVFVEQMQNAINFIKS